MTDESRIRATRPHGLPQAQQAAAGRVRRTEDPLAELARLIGQDDPFADFVAHRPADNRAGGHAAAPRRPRAQEGRSYDARTNERRRPPQSARASEFDIEDATDSPDSQRDAKRGTYAYGGGRAPRADTAPPVTHGGRDEAPAARDARPTSTRDEEDSFAPRRNAKRMAEDVGYETYDGGDYDPDYADDAYLPAHGDEFYDEAPRRRLKGWMMVGIAAVAAIVVGTSGLFAYRAIFGPTNTGSAPKMIRSETAPTKMVPGATTQADNKPSQDRIGGEAAKSERIVSREERPIDPNRIPQGDPIARIAAGGTVSASPPSAPAQAAPAMESSPSMNASTEPRRVRTVTVRSDGTVVNNAATATVATPAARQPVPTTGNPLALQGGPAQAATMPPQRPSQGDNPWANLAGQQSAPAQQAALPPQQQAAPAIAVNTPQPAGSYVVQVAAQKSEAEAQSSWQALQQRYGTVLAGQQATIRRVDLGERGVFYRAQVGPFSTRAQASEVCQSLKAAGGECVIQRN